MIKQTEQGFEFWYQMHFVWDWFTKKEEACNETNHSYKSREENKVKKRLNYFV